MLGAVTMVGVSMSETLSGFPRTKRMLVVLDNCEHLLGAVRDLVEGFPLAGARRSEGVLHSQVFSWAP